MLDPCYPTGGPIAELAARVRYPLLSFIFFLRLPLSAGDIEGMPYISRPDFLLHEPVYKTWPMCTVCLSFKRSSTEKIELEEEDQKMEPVRRPRVLAEIDPHSEWVHGLEFDTLVVDVTGFGKEHLKVQVERSGSLKITGERAVDGSGRQWLHFTKRFDLPAGCGGGDAAEIKVQLDKGMLYVQVPRHLAGATAAGAAGNGGSSDYSERYEDAVRGGGGGGGEDEAGDGWNVGGVAMARREEQSPLRWLAGELSRHRQVVLNVLLAVVLLWLVAFGAKNKPGGGGGQAD